MQNEQQQVFHKQSRQQSEGKRKLETRSNEQQQPRNQEQPEQQMTLMDQFKQQMMKAWQPVPTLTKTIVLFFIMAAIFLGIGIPMIILTQNLTQNIVRYDNLISLNCTIGSVCNVQLQVATTMKAPVFVYYQIHNFYQNHRLYASSFSHTQLIGNSISSSTASNDCDPIVYNSNLYVNKSAFTSVSLNPNQIAYPCGMIAYTIFNDTYRLFLPNGTQAAILDYGIAWPSDVNSYTVINPDKYWYNITSERFMNWMRIAAFSDFRKLWGRILTDLQPGNYTVQILNQYDLSKINGQKYFVLSTANFFGSKSNFLSISYISIGSVCLMMGFLFLMRKLFKKRKIL